MSDGQYLAGARAPLSARGDTASSSGACNGSVLRAFRDAGEALDRARVDRDESARRAPGSLLHRGAAGRFDMAQAAFLGTARALAEELDRADPKPR